MSKSEDVSGHRVPRDVGYEAVLYRLFDAIDPKRDNSWREYGTPFENDVFAVRCYDWGDADERLPNFEHKPSGFSMEWYKYPLRGCYSNRRITLPEFVRMIDECIESVKAGRR